MAPEKAAKPGSDAKFAEVVQQLAGGYKTVGQMVYGVLREAIVTGAFAPGDWLRQESLAETIGVSRIPVRTALLQLESEGLVTFHPHRGARVRTLSVKQIDEIYRLRMLLEPYALRLSMARMTPERIANLRELAKRLDGMDHGQSFMEARIAFYREVYDAANNTLLVEIIEELRSHVGRYLLELHHHQSARSSTHGELIDHMAGGDLTAAEAWQYSHLEQVRQGLAQLAKHANQEDADAPLALDVDVPAALSQAVPPAQSAQGGPSGAESATRNGERRKALPRRRTVPGKRANG